MRESLTTCSPWIPLLRLAVRKSHHHHRTTATTATAPLTGTSQPTTQPMVFPIPSHFAGTKCLQNFRKKKKIKFVPRKNVLPLGLRLIFFFLGGGLIFVKVSSLFVNMLVPALDLGLDIAWNLRGLLPPPLPPLANSFSITFLLCVFTKHILHTLYNVQYTQENRRSRDRRVDLIENAQALVWASF